MLYYGYIENMGLMLEQQGDLARASALMQIRVDFLWALEHSDAEDALARLEKVQARLAEQGSG